MPKRVSEFKQTHPLDKRTSESSRILQKYPDRIPIILERDPKSDIPLIDKKKYLVPGDLTVSHFVQVVRKRLKLEPEKGIFLFVNNQLPALGMLMSTLYEEQKDEDGFIYLWYSGENTFGSN
eukprot:ANDGO_05307.mRNA.1 Autophagy-related protein 8d